MYKLCLQLDSNSFIFLRKWNMPNTSLFLLATLSLKKIFFFIELGKNDKCTIDQKLKKSINKYLNKYTNLSIWQDSYTDHTRKLFIQRKLILLFHLLSFILFLDPISMNFFWKILLFLILNEKFGNLCLTLSLRRKMFSSNQQNNNKLNYF